jgi:peptide subunit release factor RF-3
MYIIQANPSGTRTMEVSNENLRTIEKQALFRHLIDSTGIVDEDVLDKLKLNIRALVASQEEDSKELLDLCIDVIYHSNMKAFGLQQLIKLYITWLTSPDREDEEV